MPSRYESRQGSYGEYTGGNKYESCKVVVLVGVGADKSRRQQFTRDRARQQANDEPGRRQQNALLHYHPQNRQTNRPKGHADADFFRAPARRVRHETVKADKRQRQAHGSRRGDGRPSSTWPR